MTMHKFENTGSSQNLDGLLFPTHPYSPHFAPSDFHLSGSLKDVIHSLSDDEVTEKVVASTKFTLVRVGHSWTCFVLAQGF
jgi:hypothetical protein